jgi:hypothetical protein
MASSLVPDYEVKILMRASEVLDSNNKLKNAVKNAFFITSNKKMSIQFIDTKGKQFFYTNGWSLRIRKTEDEDDFELTYKMRYLINEEFSATAQGRIDTAVKAAEQDGFDSSSAFEAQVEVGYSKLTLSISHDENVSAADFAEMDLPTAEKSSEFFAEKAHGNFETWLRVNSGTDHLEKAVVYGPVHAKRSKGTWNHNKLTIEVWPIRKSKDDGTLEPIVEASFKTSDLSKALKGRDELAEFLDKKGWLVPAESLKTKLIMERYGEGFGDA